MRVASLSFTTVLPCAHKILYTIMHVDHINFFFFNINLLNRLLICKYLSYVRNTSMERVFYNVIIKEILSEEVQTKKSLMYYL